MQNGGPEAITVSWPELVRAASGKEITALDPASTADRGIVEKFGTALDALLPQLNRPDSFLRSTSRLIGVETNGQIAGNLRSALSAPSGPPVVGLAWPGQPESVYPDSRLSEVTGGGVSYFSVVLYPTGGRESRFRALNLHADEIARGIGSDGHCLLVAIEYNGKEGKDLALLNWELIDLAKVSLRCAVGFEADQNSVHQPGATITDGRKGRD